MPGFNISLSAFILLVCGSCLLFGQIPDSSKQINKQEQPSSLKPDTAVSPDSEDTAATSPTPPPVKNDTSGTEPPPTKAADTSLAKPDSVDKETDSIPAPQKALSTDTSAVPDTIVSDSNKIDSLARPETDSGLNVPQEAAVVQDSSAKQDSLAAQEQKPADGQPAPEKKLKKPTYRESRINTINEMKGRYKSPKKAMFMSLTLPGLGQAYVGDYIRGSAYAIIEIGLGVGWYHYVVTKRNRQVRRYRKFADEHWSHAAYEDSIYYHYGDYDNDAGLIQEAHPTRNSFCDAVFPSNINEHETCINFGDSTNRAYQDYDHFTSSRWDKGRPVDSITAYRSSNFPDLFTFYELIGKHDEYVTGWDDAEDVEFIDTLVLGTSENRKQYRSMRAKATEYSRMQAFFLGGLVLNHLISALDAAIAARLNNKKLYQTEVKWYDRIILDSYLVFDGPVPVPSVTAYLPF